MTDRTVTGAFGDIKYRDLGDGTYAPYVFSAAADVTSATTGGVAVTGTAGALNADAFSQDVSAFRYISVQILGTWSGTLTFQASNDNTNFTNTVLQNATNTVSAAQTATSSSNLIFSGPIGFKYFRVRMTAYTSGTATVVVLLSSSVAGSLSTGVNASQNGTWNTSVNATPTVTTVSVATTSTSVLGTQATRKAVTLSNVGANNIFINFAGGTAVATNTLLTPNSTIHIDQYVTTGAITAIAATSATNLSVTEWV